MFKIYYIHLLKLLNVPTVLWQILLKIESKRIFLEDEIRKILAYFY